jgi:hypothetical protein
MKRVGTYYLNNRGDRGVTFGEDGRRIKISLSTSDGGTVERRVRYWEAFGNFSVAAISWRGKVIKVLPDTVLD